MITPLRHHRIVPRPKWDDRDSEKAWHYAGSFSLMEYSLGSGSLGTNYHALGKPWNILHRSFHACFFMIRPSALYSCGIIQSFNMILAFARSPSASAPQVNNLGCWIGFFLLPRGLAIGKWYHQEPTHPIPQIPPWEANPHLHTYILTPHGPCLLVSITLQGVFITPVVSDVASRGSRISWKIILVP